MNGAMQLRERMPALQKDSKNYLDAMKGQYLCLIFFGVN